MFKHIYQYYKTLGFFQILFVLSILVIPFMVKSIYVLFSKLEEKLINL